MRGHDSVTNREGARHRRRRLHRLAPRRAAARRGWEVYALDDLSTGSLGNVEHLRTNADFHLVVDSVLHHAVVNELVHKCDVVYHLAAAVGVRLIVEQPVHTIITNLHGTEIVLDHCARFGKRVLIASTSEVYGDHREEKPLDEDGRRVYGPTTQRRWAYADSKAMDEFLALAYHQERGLDCVIARLFNTVGPRQTRPVRDGRAALRGARARRRAARDLRRRHADALLLPRAGHDPRAAWADGRTTTSGEIFNVGSSEQIAIIDLARSVIETTGSLVRRRSSSAYEEAYGHGIEDMLHRIPSIEKIRAAIGWQPTLSLDKILADVIEHVRGQAGALHSAAPG